VSNESIWGLRGCLEQGCLGLRRVKHVSFVFVYSAQPHDQNGLTHVPLHNHGKVTMTMLTKIALSLGLISS